MDRVMVFIDGANLLFGMINNDISPKNLDYHKLVKKLVGDDRKLIRVYYYDAPIDQSKDAERYKKQQGFFYYVGHLPYFQLRKGRMMDDRQKGVDVKIALEMVAHGYKDNYDTAILISGDSDLVSAMETIREQGKHIELAFFDQCRDLKDNCDIFVELDKKFFSSLKKIAKN